MKKIILLSLLSATALTACARAKEELGLTRRTPDEFAVIRNAPLAIPPDLNQVTALPAPQPGLQRPQEMSPEVAAQNAILGTAAQTTDQESNAESNLLQKAGATPGITNIREVVNREAIENADKNRPVVKKIMNMGNKRDEGSASIVDAPAEAARIKAKKSGETPSIEE